VLPSPIWPGVSTACHAAAGALWELRASAATRIDVTVRRSGSALWALDARRPPTAPAAHAAGGRGDDAPWHPGDHAGHRGASRLRNALDTHTPGTTLTRSELEERFLGLCDDLALARPKVNHHVDGLEVDFVFEAARLCVETDGWRHHRSRHAFERDRHRDATLARAGYRTLRFTHRQLTSEPRTVAATLAAALHHPAALSAGAPARAGG
jgi:very-short-patch-repair endonuclease